MNGSLPFPDLPPQLQCTAKERSLSKSSYRLFDCVLQVTGKTSSAPFAAEFAARRRSGNLADADASVITLPGGGSAVSISRSSGSTFALHEQIRTALKKAGHRPELKLAVDIRPGAASARQKAEIAYCALAAAAAMPRIEGRRDDCRKSPAPAQVRIYGMASGSLLKSALERARANHLARWLAALPGNLLTPERLIELASEVGRQDGLQAEMMSISDLARAGAGAFTAVTGRDGTGGLLRLTWSPGKRVPARKIALVGKGVTFDTGGVNSKPHRHMLNMHADMAGAAACLAATCAAARLNLPLHIDCWLAAADNRIFRQAYAPGDVVRAANGTTIEIVHSDAEGRMLLADALYLAARRRPREIVSLATLTGSMIAAVGTRMSGILASSPALLASALDAAAGCGERMVAFPIAADYDCLLKSKTADVRQCAESGNADHIAASLLLKRFVGGRDWLHVDMAASHHEGGLGAIASDHTGFGASWAVQWLINAARRR